MQSSNLSFTHCLHMVSGVFTLNTSQFHIFNHLNALLVHVSVATHIADFSGIINKN